jgi:predicted RNase H-like HicB family nuclease
MSTIQSKLLNMASAFPATVVVHKATDGGYWVESPQFGGCFASADTIRRALDDFKYCLFDYFDIPKKSQKPNGLRYVSTDFPEPTSEAMPESMEMQQSPELLVA